jgi:hypothetical protein
MNKRRKKIIRLKYFPKSKGYPFFAVTAVTAVTKIKIEANFDENL